MTEACVNGEGPTFRPTRHSLEGLRIPFRVSCGMAHRSFRTLGKPKGRLSSLSPTTCVGLIYLNKNLDHFEVYSIL